jgi:pSer/pThr/pTyr-binding forkhead associated (FHA) protein
MNPAGLPGAVQILLLAVLYAFLGTVLVYLWLDERRAVKGAATFPPAHLTLLSDSAQPGFPLSASTLIGRAADNAIRLDDPLVSAYHARLSYAGGQWLLEDLGSRNGSKVNDLKIDSPIALASGDELQIGSARLRFGLGPPPAPL